MKIYTDTYYIGAANTSYKPESMAIANAMMLELAQYGIGISEQLLDRLTRTTPSNALQFCKSVLKDYTVGKLNPPLFPNWESRTEFTFGEIVVQIFGYALQISGNDLYDPNFMTNLLSNVTYVEKKTLLLATEEDAKARFAEIAASKVSLDRDSIRLLAKLAKEFSINGVSLPRIYSGETRALVALEMSKDYGICGALDLLKCAPIDALRFAAVMEDITTANLPSDVIYAPLTWQSRNQLLMFLDKFNTDELLEATGINREAWFRFYKHVHLFQQKAFINRYPFIGLVARISIGMNNSKMPSRYSKIIKSFLDAKIIELSNTGRFIYRTFASRVAMAIEDRDLNTLKTLLAPKGSYLLRNLATISNGVSKADADEFVEFVRLMIPRADPNVLLSILGINVDATYRVIDVKGNSTLSKAAYPKFIVDIQDDIRLELHKRYGFDGKVIVDEKIANNVVPFLSKNSELGRGTKYKLDQSKYLYMFVHWVQGDIRTDLDLSMVTFDSKWKSEIVYFGSQVSRYVTHSGDITNAPAPEGATEYIRIDLSNIKASAKYIMPIINVYSGSVFNANKQAYAGFMLSNSPDFTINREHTRYDLTSPAMSNMPFMLDVAKEEITILDFNNRMQNGLTAHSELGNMKNLIAAANDKIVVTVGKLAEILSGDQDEISLIITEKSSKENPNEIEPNQLSKLFN